MSRRFLAQDTLKILHQGWYEPAPGVRVNLAAPQAAAEAGTRVYAPSDAAALQAAPGPHITTIEVSDESTFAAGRRLAAESPAVLNFASAKNPGGGFLGGADAQEECLARASGLYPCLLQARPYYDANRACGTCLYTHHLIYSPGVPVFRDDQDRLDGNLVLLSIITAPAVNVGAIGPHERPAVESLMRQRTDYVLRVAASHGHGTLVLGAWGCGVFRNVPDHVARWFEEALHGPFRGRFSRVVFAVPSRHSANHRAFVARFGQKKTQAAS